MASSEMQSQRVVVLEHIRVAFVNGRSVDADCHMLSVVVNLIVRHGETTLPLLGEHLLDTTAHGINHIEICQLSYSSDVLR